MVYRGCIWKRTREVGATGTTRYMVDFRFNRVSTKQRGRIPCIDDYVR